MFKKGARLGKFQKIEKIKTDLRYQISAKLILTSK